MSKTVFIGNASAYTTAANPNLLAAGEIGVYSIATNGTFTLLTNGTTPGSGTGTGLVTAAVKLLPLMIAQGIASGTTTNFRSVTLQPRSVIAGSVPATATTYSAAIPNIYTIGFSGVSGDSNTIAATTAGTYGININNMSKGIPPFPYTSWNKSYPATPNALTVGYDMMKGINANTLNNIATGALPEETFVWASLVSGTASTSLRNVANSADVTATVTNGSTAVILTTGSSTITVADGSYIRLGSATDLGAPIYKVLSGCSAVASPATITLDSPYVNGSMAMGASASAVAVGGPLTPGATIGVRFVAFGNSFNGIPVTQLTPNKQIFVYASGNLFDLGSVITTNTVVAKPYLNAAGAVVTTGVYFEGQGLGYQVQKEEFIAMGYFGFNNRVFLPFSNPYYALATSNYDGFAFKYNGYWEDKTAQGIGRQETSEIEIFCVNNATQSGDTLAAAIVPTIIALYAA
jgi:hypothetical protein